MKNPLTEYFYHNPGKLIHKWVHYFDIYHRHFEKFRGKPVKILEFGVFQGGSLEMWRHYFGKKAEIYGVDINPKCKAFEDKNITIFIGDQADRKFLKKLMAEIGEVDVVIEDGGHTMAQQIHTFEEVYPYVKAEGVYLVEDLHTSYWHEYNGGYRHRETFIEYAKNIIDDLHAWHSRDPESFTKTDFTSSVKGMHIYDSIIVFDKGSVEPPHHEMTGKKMYDWE